MGEAAGASYHQTNSPRFAYSQTQPPRDGGQTRSQLHNPSQPQHRVGAGGGGRGPGDSDFICPYPRCGMRFTTMRALEEHINHIHEDPGELPPKWERGVRQRNRTGGSERSSYDSDHDSIISQTSGRSGQHRFGSGTRARYSKQNRAASHGAEQTTDNLTLASLGNAVKQLQEQIQGVTEGRMRSAGGGRAGQHWGIGQYSREAFLRKLHDHCPTVSLVELTEWMEVDLLPNVWKMQIEVNELNAEHLMDDAIQMATNIHHNRFHISMAGPHIFDNGKLMGTLKNLKSALQKINLSKGDTLDNDMLLEDSINNMTTTLAKSGVRWPLWIDVVLSQIQGKGGAETVDRLNRQLQESKDSYLRLSISYMTRLARDMFQSYVSHASYVEHIRNENRKLVARNRSLVEVAHNLVSSQLLTMLRLDTTLKPRYEKMNSCCRQTLYEHYRLQMLWDAAPPAFIAWVKSRERRRETYYSHEEVLRLSTEWFELDSRSGGGRSNQHIWRNQETSHQVPYQPAHLLLDKSRPKNG